MKNFSRDFLLGTATAAHQVEGNNTHSDFWAMEHMKYTTYTEPSEDACNPCKVIRKLTEEDSIYKKRLNSRSKIINRNNNYFISFEKETRRVLNGIRLVS